MPRIIVVAGPNGAGKTSFANRYLPEAERPLAYVNADEIARETGFADLPPSARDIAAGREMLRRLDALADMKSDFMFETTLASRTYAARWRKWSAAGYRIELIYLRLPDVAASLARVARRVAAGGHSIPETTIRRRFERSLEYLQTLYKPLSDACYIYDSKEGDFELAEEWIKE
jgi:predicted ABC-type ATPase